MIAVHETSLAWVWDLLQHRTLVVAETSEIVEPDCYRYTSLDLQSGRFA